MAFLVAPARSQKHHIVKKEKKTHYVFYCGRKKPKRDCKEVDRENLGVNTCSVCATMYYNGPKCNSSQSIEETKVGSVIRVPREISETGLIRIVGDQTNCMPNQLQPGVGNWHYLAVTHDPDDPKRFNQNFCVMKEELEMWKEIYK